MDLFTEVELLIMGSILGGLLLLVIILVISELVSRKKDKIEEYEEDEVLVQEVTKEKNVEIEEDSCFLKLDKMYMEATSNISVIETHENKIEEIVQPSIIMPEEEIELIEELDEAPSVIKIESEFDSLLDAREKAQIELLKVEEELENNRSLEDTITNLETIEEENAIISYQELLSTTGELDVVTCDSGDEPITISEVFKMFNEAPQEELENVSLDKAYQGSFLETPYLSPVNGIESESLTEIQLENTANLEKLEKEIRKTNEFLNILNELKKNLE